ncbi:MAG TPA: glycosyltransferase family 2 protein [Beijerinckia sp.]|nr:glycosyltransferase family 2 protein [Beijerinckia sp.]
MANLAVVILTFNEELHIERSIASVASFASEIFVVDSFSTDRTVELAKGKGATILQNKFINQAKQFQWALDNLPITAEWIMRLDADEVIEPDLAAEIEQKLPTLGTDVVGINLNRKHVFLGRWIKHGGRYPMYLLRIWRRGHGRIEDRWMDEHMLVWGGRTINFKGGFADHNLHDLTYFIDKHNKYATREAIEIINKKHGLFASDPSLMGEAGSSQARAKKWLKENLFNRLPFWLAAAAYFLLRYIVQGGFLDGTEGLTYHVLQGYWYRFLVGAKVLEYQRALAEFPEPEKKIAELARLTGHQIYS